MFTDDRNAYRRSFFEAWQKHLNHLPLEPLEAQLVSVMQAHPEYHALLENEKQFLTQAFEPEENPFMHLSLHLAVREQIQMNRPNGITALYQEALSKFPHAHEAEHELVDTLGQLLWQAQQNGLPPDEDIYLETLREALAQN
jgi:hypothetical protein